MIDTGRESTPLAHYHVAFPNDLLPLVYWHHGTTAELLALIEHALAIGVPLTDVDLLAAQGLPPPPGR